MAFALSAGPPTVTGVSVLPAGRRAPSSPRHPLRWKSLMRMASFRGSGDSARMLPATFNAGPNRVAAGVGIAVSIDAIKRSFSAVDRSAMSAPDEKSTTEPRSDAPSLLIASRAAAFARSHRSP